MKRIAAAALSLLVAAAPLQAAPLEGGERPILPAAEGLATALSLQLSALPGLPLVVPVSLPPEAPSVSPAEQAQARADLLGENPVSAQPAAAVPARAEPSASARPIWRGAGAPRALASSLLGVGRGLRSLLRRGLEGMSAEGLREESLRLQESLEGRAPEERAQEGLPPQEGTPADAVSEGFLARARLAPSRSARLIKSRWALYRHLARGTDYFKPFLLPYKRKLGGLRWLLFINAACSGLIWVAAGKAADLAMAGHAAHSLLAIAPYFAGALAMCGLKIWGQRLVMVVVQKTATEAIRDFRMSYFAHLLRLPAEAWGSAAPEKMAPRLLNNLDYLSPKDIILPLYMPYYAAMFLISAGLFLYADWHMALLALAGVPLSLLVALSYGDVYQSTNDSYTTRSAGMVTSADKYLHRFEDIQLNGMEEAARALFDRQAEDLAQVGILRAYAYGGYQAAGGVLSDFFTRLPIAALQIWSLFWRGKPTMGTIGATQGLIGNMREAVDGIAQAIMRAQEADGALEIIGRLARAKPRIEPWDALPLGPMQGAISVRGVGFSYSPEGPPALKDVSLEILPGQSVALAGRNGSGKSTLLRLIAGTLRPASGEVLIDGVPLEKIERAGFLKQISFLSQKPALFPGTARHNLLLAAPRSTAEQIEEALRQADAEFLLRRPEGLDVDVSHLSGGELQRLLLARALLRRPKLLLLDEAASALDPVTKRGVEEALERGRLERTTIQVSHDPAALKRADRIVVLDEGRIVETGSYDELMARRGAFYKLAHAAAAKSRRRR